MNPVEIKRGDSFKNLSKYLLKGKTKAPTPEEMLAAIASQNSVFTESEISRYLSKIAHGQPSTRHAIDRILACPDLVVMRSKDAGDQNLYFSTLEMVSLEKTMMESTMRMAKRSDHGVSDYNIDRALDAANAELLKTVNAELSQEQVKAVKSITGNQDIAMVSGYAGAGKSTMLSAARDAWESQGYTVYGAALAGKAAEGLQDSSGIESRTLASIELGWKHGYQELAQNDVLVIDEAGMIGSKQLSRFINTAEKSGCKLVLVGDSEQLQAIGAGAAFRQSVDALGTVELQQVLRQSEKWQQNATKDFAKNRTAAALSAYEQNGCIRFSAENDKAINELVRDYLADIEEHPNDTRLALAHRRFDVRLINDQIRHTRLEADQIKEGVEFKTDNGLRDFSVGDRLIFLENNRDLDVKNGMLGSVLEVDEGRLQVQLDGDDMRIVEVDQEAYNKVDYGYASTIHKSQGASVDRSFVLASFTMDRHLTYVAMSRHRDSTALYASKEQFKSQSDLSRRLSREGLKRTSLDYEVDLTRSMRPDIETVEEKKKVGWTKTYNLGKAADLDAWKHMAATAESANEVKRAIAESKGEKFRGGKKCTKPVYHFSITWSEDDLVENGGNLTDELQRKAVDDVLKELQLDNHQALAVQHLDGKPHVHMMVNLIDPDTGISASSSMKQANGRKASKLSYSHKKLRQWANRFEVDHGLKITLGSENNEKLRKEGVKVDARRKSRVSWERDQTEALTVNLDNFEYKPPAPANSSQAKHTFTARDIAEQGKELEDVTQAAYMQLNSSYLARMKKLREERAAELKKHERLFSHQYKESKVQLKFDQQKRRQQFFADEKHAPTGFLNSVSTYFIAKNERDSILTALYAATSSKERREVLKRWDDSEFAALYAQENDERVVYLDKFVHQVSDKSIQNLQSEYLKRDNDLKRYHSKNTSLLQARWADYKLAREQKNEEHLKVDVSAKKDFSQERGNDYSEGLTP